MPVLLFAAASSTFHFLSTSVLSWMDYSFCLFSFVCMITISVILLNFFPIKLICPYQFSELAYSRIFLFIDDLVGVVLWFGNILTTILEV